MPIPTHRDSEVGQVVVEASVEIRATAEDVLAFVMDLDRYREADHKIRKVRWLRRDGDVVIAALSTRTAGLPARAIQRLRLTPGIRIDVTNEPSWQDRFTSFHGEFLCTATDSGVHVTHRYTFTFRGPGRLIGALLKGWLARDIVQEVNRLRTLLEHT